MAHLPAVRATWCGGQRWRSRAARGGAAAVAGGGGGHARPEAPSAGSGWREALAPPLAGAATGRRWRDGQRHARAGRQRHVAAGGGGGGCGCGGWRGLGSRGSGAAPAGHSGPGGLLQRQARPWAAKKSFACVNGRKGAGGRTGGSRVWHGGQLLGFEAQAGAPPIRTISDTILATQQSRHVASWRA